MIFKNFICRYMICTYIIYCLVYTAYTYTYHRENLEKENKKHLRNLEAENSPKFKKHPGWPKKLVSYKKKMCREVCQLTSQFLFLNGNHELKPRSDLVV